MELFWTLLIKLIPLYIMILAGFIAARTLHIHRESVARLLIYIVAPVVVFYGAYTATLDSSHLSLPIIFFLIGSIFSMLFYGIGKWVFGEDSTKNILAFSAGTGNTGYFGIPAALALMGDQALSSVVLCILGVILYENSVGYFFIAKGHYTVAQSLKKVAFLPSLHAFFVGIALNFFHVPIGEIAVSTVTYFKGAYTLMGMMIMGMGLAAVKIQHIDFKYISLSMFAKFVVWPVVMGGLVLLDQTWFHSYGVTTQNVLYLMGIVPLAANTVAFAAELNMHPDKAALAVLLSTVFAIFYIPWMAIRLMTL